MKKGIEIQGSFSDKTSTAYKLKVMAAGSEDFTEYLYDLLNDYVKNAALYEAAPEMLEALIEITKGEGAYDFDKLKHASNTIDNMKELANQAIKKARL